jgi:hypothetical protein
VSSVTEVLMACGSWELNLDPASPRSIVENIPTWSTICVTPGRCDGLSRSEVLAQATYSGILRSRTDNLCTLRGPSILAWLGDEDGKGPQPSIAIDGTTSAQDMISDLFTSSFGVFVNGIALGTYSSLSASPVWAAATGTESSRTFLDRVSRFLGWKYRVNADGTFDICDDDSLFQTTPSVVVLADHFGEPISDVIRLVVAGKIRASASDDDYVTDIAILDGTYVGTASVGSSPYNFDFTATINQASIDKTITTTDLGSNANADAQAALEIVTNYATKNFIDVSIRLDDPRTRIQPGDSLYVYDPLQGLFLAAGTQLDIMGQVIFPVTVDVSEMTWPITEGMGVYALLQGSTTVWDLSEYVLWGTGDCNLKVGAKWPTMREAVNGRN